MKALLKGIGYTLLTLVLAIAAYLGYVLLRYQDIPVAELASKQTQTMQVLDNTVYYQRQGNPDAPNLVLIHSHFFTMDMWDSWVALLSPHFNIIRYDLTSHGLTGAEVNHDYSMAQDVALLAGLVEQLQLDSFILVGSSLGGNIALNYTAAHPDKVSALVLQNSGGFRKANSRGGRAEDMPWWADYLLYVMPKLAFEKFYKWVVVDVSAHQQHNIDAFHNGFLREGNREAEIKRMRQFKLGGTAEALQKITVPVLIQWGQDNPQLPVALAENFVEHLTRASKVEVEIYPKAGHVLALEQPRQSANTFIDFVNQL
ncbi:alpha/beta fold hydrolase [Paraferrimonas sp. SM1919]|uniref:alpha/beta fold hydrolase n=1 Tax=Paraferrimonas sp. SM1919 TaxID=2662263 RepID=UPI0013D8D6A6|nr:alpha/beta hydrolase [Paraferrimonas sp. SM1919]